MIPRAHIVAWKAKAPWIEDTQVEQDLVLHRAIVEIYSDPVLGARLAFRGGTALHKVFLTPASRYSEDLDFVQVEAGPIGDVMDAIRKRLDPWLGKPKRNRGEGRVTFYYRFDSETLPNTPMRLKIEINTREHFSVMGLIRRPISVESPWFTGTAEVTTYPVEELLGTKLRALHQRKKGRDLFDLATALQRLPGLDALKVVDCFNRYLMHDGLRVSRAEFEEVLSKKVGDPVFCGDLSALLTTEALGSFDIDAAAGEVLEILGSKLSGAPWKGEKRQT